MNGQAVVLKNKDSYIFVDILDFYSFDTSTARGSSVDMTVNGIKAEFTTPLHDGDVISLSWKD